MEHVAIDLGGRESQICVRAQDGTIVEERRWKTGELGRYLKRRPASRVVLETCAEAFSVADEAQAQGHEVRVVPATLAPALGVGERGTKTDTRDARKLSEVSTRIDLPSVHVPSSEARERKRLCGARDSLVQARTQLINHVRGALRTERVRIRPGKTETFVKRVQDSCRSVPGQLTAVLTAIEQLSEHIAALDKQVAQTAENDATCQLLMTMPGVGPVTALRFVATVDERKRFESAHKLEAYLGLAPGEDSSSDRKRRTGITKAGPTAMRWTLVQAAWAARRAKGKHPMLLWAQAIELRRGKRVAAIALARKMAGILYAMWRDRLPYDAHRAAVIPAPALK